MYLVSVIVQLTLSWSHQNNNSIWVVTQKKRKNLVADKQSLNQSMSVWKQTFTGEKKMRTETLSLHWVKFTLSENYLTQVSSLFIFGSDAFIAHFFRTPRHCSLLLAEWPVAVLTAETDHCWSYLRSSWTLLWCLWQQYLGVSQRQCASPSGKWLAFLLFLK